MSKPVGVQRVAAPAGGRCWMCGMTAVAGERLPGHRSRTRLLCRRHDRLVFGGTRDDDTAPDRATR